MAWHQGEDLYRYWNNWLPVSAAYVAKTNLADAMATRCTRTDLTLAIETPAGPISHVGACMKKAAIGRTIRVDLRGPSLRAAAGPPQSTGRAVLWQVASCQPWP